MRKWTMILAVAVAAWTAAPARCGEQEIVSGFRGGSSPLEPVPDNTGTSVQAADASQASREPGRTPTGKHRSRRASVRRAAGVPLRPIVIPRPPLAAVAAPRKPEEASMLTGVRWGHPLAIGAGLMPLAAAVLLLLLRALRMQRQRPVMPMPASFPIVAHEESETPVVRIPRTGDAPGDGARRHAAGQPELRLARLLERSPNVSVRKINALALDTEADAEGAGIARTLRTGKGEVQLALRLRQLAAGTGGAQ
jgi:hypothetical protein